MNELLILVDSSAWISYLAGEKNDTWQSVADLLEENSVATNHVIRAEILTGAKDEAQYDELSSQWEGLHFLPMTTSVWRRAERLRFELRKKGYLIPLPDILIASTALAYGCGLLQTDRHFQYIAKHIPLKFFKR